MTVLKFSDSSLWSDVFKAASPFRLFGLPLSTLFKAKRIFLWRVFVGKLLLKTTTPDDLELELRGHPARRCDHLMSLSTGNCSPVIAAYKTLTFRRHEGSNLGRLKCYPNPEKSPRAQALKEKCMLWLLLYFSNTPVFARSIPPLMLLKPI